MKRLLVSAGIVAAVLGLAGCPSTSSNPTVAPPSGGVGTSQPSIPGLPSTAPPASGQPSIPGAP